MSAMQSLSPGGTAILAISAVIFASLGVRAFVMWRADRRLKKAINAINVGLPYG